MKNLSGNISGYSNLIKKGKNDDAKTDATETQSVQLDPKAVQEIISDYEALLGKCEKLYETKADKNVGDFFISLATLRKVIEKF